MILLPNADGTVSSDWIRGGSPPEGTVHDSLDDDNGDTSFVACDTGSETMIIEFADPDDVTSANSGVAEAEIDTITSVRFISSGRSTDRRFASLVVIEYADPSGNANETCSYDSHASSYETINGTAHETYDGTHDWDYSKLEGLQLTCDKLGTQNIQLSYLAIEVTYTEAVTADNATFFGANF